MTKSFFWSHTGWFLTKENFLTEISWVKELARFPELKLIDRFDLIVPIFFCVGLFILGELLSNFYPELATSGWQLVSWGFVLSTVILYHSTFLINSASHLWGKRRYKTKSSLLAAENDDVIEAFVSTNNAQTLATEFDTGVARRHGWQSLPHRRGGDGLYFAMLLKPVD